VCIISIIVKLVVKLHSLKTIESWFCWRRESPLVRNYFWPDTFYFYCVVTNRQLSAKWPIISSHTKRKSQQYIVDSGYFIVLRALHPLIFWWSFRECWSVGYMYTKRLYGTHREKVLMSADRLFIFVKEFRNKRENPHLFTYRVHVLVNS
jgi:hypothetical protein